MWFGLSLFLRGLKLFNNVIIILTTLIVRTALMLGMLNFDIVIDLLIYFRSPFGTWFNRFFFANSEGVGVNEARAMSFISLSGERRREIRGN